MTSCHWDSAWIRLQIFNVSKGQWICLHYNQACALWWSTRLRDSQGPWCVGSWRQEFTIEIQRPSPMWFNAWGGILSVNNAGGPCQQSVRQMLCTQSSCALGEVLPANIRSSHGCAEAHIWKGMGGWMNEPFTKNAVLAVDWVAAQCNSSAFLTQLPFTLRDGTISFFQMWVKRHLPVSELLYLRCTSNLPFSTITCF